MNIQETTARPEANLLLYWLILKKYRRMVAVITFCVVLGVGIGTRLMTPIYSATATLQIDPRAPNLLDVDEVFDLVEVRFSDERRAYYTTQYRIIKSRTVIEETLRRLRENHGVTEFDDAEDPVDEFLKIVELTPEGDTELVHITIEHPDPDIAVLYVRTIAETYMDENINRARRRSQQAQAELRKLKLNYGVLKRDEKETTDLRLPLDPSTPKGAVAAEMPGTEPEQPQESSLIISQRYSTVEETLKRVQTDLAEVRTKLPVMEQEYTELNALERSAGWIGLASHLASDENPVLETTYIRLQELRQEKVSSKGRYKEGHPKVIRLDAKLEGMEQLLREQVQEYILGRETRLKLTRDREHELAAQLETLTREIEALESDKVRADRMESEIERWEELYRELGQRLAEAQLSDIIRQNNVAWVDYPIASEDPVRPKLIPNLAIALVVGLMGSVGLAFFVEYIRPDDAKIRNAEDIESYVGIPFLGPVSVLNDESLKGLPTRLYAYARPRSMLAEQLRTIRTNILFRSPDKPLRRLLVTSAVPQEGKSFISSNLAAIIAMTGSRILLIDADMRRPRQHDIFNLSNNVGLANVLAGELSLEEAVHHSLVPGLDVLPAGQRPEDVEQILSSPRMAELLDSIRGYDLVLIDSPPVSPVADPLILSHIVDGVVLVVRFGRAFKQNVLHSRQRLSSVNANMLGAIGNRFDDRGGYGYGYGYGYEYGYGYGYGTDDDATRADAG